MLKRTFLSLMCVGLVHGATSARAGDLKSVDDIVAKYIEAIGGRKAIDNAKTRRMVGKNSMANGMEMPLVMEFKKPDKVRVEIEFQGMTGVQAFDGTIGWYVMPFSGKTDPEKMPPEQVKDFKSQADIDGPLVDYAKKGHKLELMGNEEIEGTDTYKLKVTRADENVEFYYLDTEYFLPIKIVRKQEFQGTPVEVESTPADYKKVGGLMLPHSLTQQMAGMPMKSTMVFEKIEVNVDLPDARFKMPKSEAPKPADKPGDKPAAERASGG